MPWPRKAVVVVTIGAVLGAAAAVSVPVAAASDLDVDSTAATTPDGSAEFVVLARPARRIIHGRHSTVRAALVTADGSALRGRPVELQAKRRLSDRWRRVTSGTTSRSGRVALSTALSATARLRLHHPAGTTAARNLGVQRVTVAKRVGVTVRRTRSRVGKTVVLRGRVGPDQRPGSAVRLQRRTSGTWRWAASGRMVTPQRYVIRWQPKDTGRFTLRVRKPRGATRAAGSSGRWRHRVKPETAADIASDIRRDGGITLATVHLSNGRDRAIARRNIRDVANGRRARTSCFATAPCRSTRVDRRLLGALRRLGTSTAITVSEIAGGAHARGSAHYSGRAVDITWVNHRHVGRGSAHGRVARVCRAYGARKIYTPSHDPWGGHHNHVHCEWD